LPYISPPEADCWGALLAARTLSENEGKRLAAVSERNAPRLERIRRWLLAIVTRGWLPPSDRALAGTALAVLGDDRDFDELVEIPAGPFLMGDDSDPDARPQREVTLEAFKIGKYPVTNGQYMRFVEETGQAWRLGDGMRPERSNCPATRVSWHNAHGYCAWLTKVWRAEGRIAAAEVVRLPTEAEWEKAARGSDGRSWPWGDEWDESRCNTTELGLGVTCAVGMFPAGASPYGCLDVAGQVWEWTTSVWGAARDMVVARGGSFDHQRGNAFCASRHGEHPDYGWDYNGFRVVVSEQ
jgi:iron(II)-dependent oxidoreductase